MRKLTYGLGGVVVFWSAGVQARPVAPQEFCNIYAEAPACAGALECAFCHDSTTPPAWNDFGEDLRVELGTQGQTDAAFIAALPGALQTLEDVDSDGDGFSNVDEIDYGTFPGEGNSVPGDLSCPDDVSGLDYPVCQYDPAMVYRKLHLDVCGRSPTYDQLQAFIALDDANQIVALDDALDTCVDTEFWIGKDGVLWRLAHPKIRPVGSLKAGEDQFSNIVIADYYNDYNLYVWSQIDGNDARAPLTADFYVTRTAEPTSYSKVADVPVVPGCGANCEEVMEVERRAGMLTTRWFLTYNVMFTPLPRTAAAQAYRAYLGYDIAKSEGLFPITQATGFPYDEPFDYDSKGVDQAACAACHSTLDPLSYAFRNYNGLTPQGGMTVGQYEPNRLELLQPGDEKLHDTPESGYLMAEPYDDLIEWAAIAANSDAFAIATVGGFWRLLLGRDPLPSEQAEFTALWQDFMSHYSVEQTLHDLIKTEAYGAP